MTKSNILWCVVDCLRHDAFSVNGYPRETTPELDGILKKDFVSFDDACTQSSFTVTSATSMFTGTYPPTHGMLTFSDQFDNELDHIGDFIGDHGLPTSLVSGMNFFSDESGLEWGLNRMFDEVYNLEDSKEGRDTNQAHADEVVDGFLDKVVGEHESFAAALWFFDPHIPRNRSEKPFSGDNPQRDAYDAEVRFVSQQLRRLFDYLQEQGLYEDTMIILTGDHGDIFQEHYLLEGTAVGDGLARLNVPFLSSKLRSSGYLGHLARPLYEELLHVPLFVKFPDDRFGGERVKEQVELIDLLPTVLDVLGPDEETPDQLQGESLRPVVSGASDGKEYTYSMTVGSEQAGRYLAIRSEQYKLLRMDPPDWSLELLGKDPKTYLARRFLTDTRRMYRKDDETQDHRTDFPDITRELDSELAEWLEKMETFREERDPHLDEGISEEQRAELENLGYL